MKAGEVFHRLTCIQTSLYKDKFNQWVDQFKCECGNIIERNRHSVRTGRTWSCGCLFKEKISTHKHTINRTRTPTYYSWVKMKERCSNPSRHNWKNYGGKGITVCQRWLDSFENFLQDMGERPEGTTLDRIDSDGNYEITNCRWATKDMQTKNRKFK